MPHVYLTDKPRLFTEDGFKYVLDTYIAAVKAITQSGATTAGHVMLGDSFMVLNALDYLVEHGYLREITAGKDVACQNRVYVLAQETERGR